MKTAALAVSVAAMLGLTADSAYAITRTFVSGGGAGTACTRTAPCASFQAAHNAADPGGEINCLDPGDFGPLTVTKSITIDCTGTLGTIRTAGTAVKIDTAGVVVTLRSLSIVGTAAASGPGIDFTNGAAVFVDKCDISGMTGTALPNGVGIRFAPVSASTAKLLISDTVISNNDAHGLLLLAAPSGASRLALDGARLENNNVSGISVTSGAGSILGQIRNTVITGNGQNGIKVSGGSGAASVTLDRSSSTLSGGGGVSASGPAAYVIMGRSAAVSNVNGIIYDGGAIIFSYQNNHLSGNVTDGSPSAALTLK
jgi:hypothetical protein